MFFDFCCFCFVVLFLECSALVCGVKFNTLCRIICVDSSHPKPSKRPKAAKKIKNRSVCCFITFVSAPTDFFFSYIRHFRTYHMYWYGTSYVQSYPVYGKVPKTVRTRWFETKNLTGESGMTLGKWRNKNHKIQPKLDILRYVPVYMRVPTYV